MQNLNIDDGKKRFTINNDPNRVIEFQPSDINLYSRLVDAQKNITKIANDMPDDLKKGIDENDDEVLERFAKLLSDLDKKVKEQIDFLFGSNVSDIVFESASSLSVVNGKFFVERFLEAVTPILDREITEVTQQSEKRINKHIGKYSKPQVKLNSDIIGDKSDDL